MNEENYFQDLLDRNGIVTQLKSRKSHYDFLSIRKSEIDDYQNDGWEIQKKNKNTVRVKRLKPAHIWFEDRVWCLFARMGFLQMSADRNFRLCYTFENRVPGKQIDVFAVDEETIFIIECKSSGKRVTTSFQKDINEINGIRANIVTTLKKSFEGKRKLVWLFCTENIVVTDNDKGRLKEHKIFHLNQDDIRYYEQLIENLGISTKYQLFARIFANQEIPEIKNRVPAIKGKMGGYTYYSFSIEPNTLLKLSYILHRVNTSDDTLNTYQRMVKKKRILEINEFLNGENNFFPNAIIINIDTKKGNQLNFDLATSSEHDSNTKLGILHLPKCYKSAFVIDGQHRLFGYGFNEYRFSHTIPVVAFENLPSDKQANLFVEINNKQKSVDANLLKTLDAELKWDSPIADDAIRALKSKLAQLLDERVESPLYNRIKTDEGKGNQTKCITLTYIFDYGLNKTHFFGEVSKKVLIRTGPLYAGDLAAKTLEKAYEFFKLYFSLIEEKLPNQWELGSSEGGFVARNIGVSSFIVIAWDIVDFLRTEKNLVFEKMSSEGIYDEVAPYLILLIRFIEDLSSDDLKNMSRQWGSTGVSKVRQEFQRVIHEKHPSFQPDGLLQYIKESSGVFNEETRDNIFQVQEHIKEYIFKTLKQEYPENANNWWRLGVPKQIQKDCAVKSIEVDPPEPPENFLLVLDYQKIVKANWKLLGELFTPPDMVQSSKDDRLSWFVDFNSIRNRVMHPERQTVTEKEYQFIKQVKLWLLERISAC